MNAVDNRIVARPDAALGGGRNIRELDQIFTPAAVVQAMLAMRRNHGRVLEPSAGAGAFMRQLESSAVGFVGGEWLVALANKVCPDTMRA